jgi:hypothetical protein
VINTHARFAEDGPAAITEAVTRARHKSLRPLIVREALR